MSITTGNDRKTLPAIKLPMAKNDGRGHRHEGEKPGNRLPGLRGLDLRVDQLRLVADVTRRDLLGHSENALGGSRKYRLVPGEHLRGRQRALEESFQDELTGLGLFYFEALSHRRSLCY
ncbi:hypothetical protein GCM10011574_04470 [Microbispora bryophytorum]|uniref:Uncharacterized protein n=1 Tax=Microbispora bryophytorum TaxID=1460882 RepID=A0A8H9LB42_9ACTN|nr:hypothetical protein GCM10011574_04470 [Microbispora bryophytorum]